MRRTNQGKKEKGDIKGHNTPVTQQQQHGGIVGEKERSALISYTARACTCRPWGLQLLQLQLQPQPQPQPQRGNWSLHVHKTEPCSCTRLLGAGPGGTRHRDDTGPDHDPRDNTMRCSVASRATGICRYYLVKLMPLKQVLSCTRISRNEKNEHRAGQNYRETRLGGLAPLPNPG